MRDVALRANVSTRTLYQYFPSKSLLLLSAFVEKSQSGELFAEASMASPDPAVRVAESFRPVTEVLLGLPQLTAGLMASLISSDTRTIPLMRAYRDGLEHRALLAMQVDEPTARDRTIAQILSHVWFAALSAWATGVDQPESVMRSVEEAAQLLLGD